ncbi:cAMP-regulated phosphoprotein 19-A-like [Saccostrea echinata]|uniref:cAMP-regulated phosphoprotein 19-A-like n=1 Tax=Saccostrea echinata TaxID=191078 RepID=UPI002A833F63|nr:cAMP-regulated phosphoprotein 19-A-like [Saccostrea echinata]
MSSQEKPEETIEENIDKSTGDDVFIKPATPELSASEKMKQEEDKLRKKYPNMKPGVGGSALLSKRLQKNKYFDSGEYNMTKAKMRGSKLPPAAQENMILQEPPGDAIPTPEAIATIRKPSLQQSKLAEHS